MKNSQLSNMLLKVGCFFLAQKFVLSNSIRIFAARELAKPLNDAQMCGSFLYIYVSSQNTLMERYISPAIESEEYVPILRVLLLLLPNSLQIGR